MRTVSVLDLPFAATDLDGAVAQALEWIANDSRTYITCSNVHSVMSSWDDDSVRAAHVNAGMILPDGMPNVWVGHLYGEKQMRRCYGPDFMLALLAATVEPGHTHYLYGGKEGVAEKLKAELERRFPGIRIVGCSTPPFRALTEAEETELAAEIERLRPDVFWVGLGCPKQEKWMHAHAGKLATKIMVGVGAAFDFHIGAVPQAPAAMQKLGLEWLFRLGAEPRRLWHRYLYHNPRYITLVALRYFGLLKPRNGQVKSDQPAEAAEEAPGAGRTKAGDDRAR